MPPVTSATRPFALPLAAAMFRSSFVAMSLRLRRRRSGRRASAALGDHARTAGQASLGKPQTPAVSRRRVRAMPVHALSALSCGPCRKSKKDRRWRRASAAGRWQSPRRCSRRWPDVGQGAGRAGGRAGPARAGGGDGDAHRGAAVRRAGVDRPHRRRRRSATPARRSTSPRAWAACRACWRATARTTRRTCRSRCAASARAPPSAIRGVRLYVDGIPATLPDGQGQISHVDLGSADRIEVLRGPFSALYGNSSGGVIQVFTEEGSGPPTVDAGVAGGSYGALRVGRARRAAAAAASATSSAATHFQHRRLPRPQRGRARHRQRQAHAGPTTPASVTLVVNSVALPKAQDPLGLTRAQFEADPRSVDPAAIAFDTRKTVDQTQVGADLRAPASTPSTRCARWSTAAIATPSSSRRSRSAPQAQPAAPGRRDRARPRLQRHRRALDRARRALGRRAVRRSSPASPTTRSTSTAAASRTSSARPLGVRGRAAPRRGQHGLATSTSTCRARGSSRRAGRCTPGVRHSKVQLRLEDHYIVGPQPRRQRQRATTTRRCRWSALMFAATRDAPPLRHRRPRLRDADAERARLPPERRRPA